MGLSDDRVVEHLTDIFCRGVLRPEKLRALKAKPARKPGARRTKPKKDA